jgi:hypothetical protein
VLPTSRAGRECRLGGGAGVVEAVAEQPLAHGGDRRQMRRLRQGASRGALAAVALAAATLVAGAGALGLGLALLVLAGGLAAASRRALHLAARSRVGAESEAEVRRVLERLRRQFTVTPIRDGDDPRERIVADGEGFAPLAAAVALRTSEWSSGARGSQWAVTANVVGWCSWHRQPDPPRDRARRLSVRQ